MASTLVVDRVGNKRRVALVYPPGHSKVGHVVFQDADEERAYDNSGEPQRRTEQLPDLNFAYEYNPWSLK